MSNPYTSATLKLTGWYVVLVMVISLVFSAVVYHFATDALTHGLSLQTQRIYREFPVFSGDPFFTRSSDVPDESRRILLNLLYFNALVLVFAGYASYWLAKHTLKPIEESNEQQKRFVADASHELRTPVTALKMSSEVALLDKNSTKDQLRETLTSNIEEVDKVDRLLRSLLQLSQLESDEIRQTFTHLSIGDLAKRVMSQVAYQADAKHITLTDKTKNITTIGDGDSLVQLLVILLDNAIKYSPTESEVTIESHQDAHAVSLMVSDHGIGIAPAALVHVFDRFYRADSSRGTSKGYGLGLSIAKRITELHHGNITITSMVGKGTRVVVSVPKRND